MYLFPFSDFHAAALLFFLLSDAIYREAGEAPAKRVDPGSS
jgi:hypothetical protein